MTCRSATKHVETVAPTPDRAFAANRAGALQQMRTGDAAYHLRRAYSAWLRDSPSGIPMDATSHCASQSIISRSFSERSGVRRRSRLHRLTSMPAPAGRAERILIICAPIELAPARLWAYSHPTASRRKQYRVLRSCHGAREPRMGRLGGTTHRFAAADHPVDTRQVQRIERAEERLRGYEPHRGLRDTTQGIRTPRGSHVLYGRTIQMLSDHGS